MSNCRRQHVRSVVMSEHFYYYYDALFISFFYLFQISIEIWNRCHEEVRRILNGVSGYNFYMDSEERLAWSNGFIRNHNGKNKNLAIFIRKIWPAARLLESTLISVKLWRHVLVYDESLTNDRLQRKPVSSGGLLWLWMSCNWNRIWFGQAADEPIHRKLMKWIFPKNEGILSVLTPAWMKIHIRGWDVPWICNVSIVDSKGTFKDITNLRGKVIWNGYKEA